MTKSMADKINGKLKNGHSNCSFDIKCLGILLFFGTSYTNFLLAISALGKLYAAARRGSLYARTNGVQHCLQPISIQAGTPNSCHTELLLQKYPKTILDLDLASITYFQLSTSLKSNCFTLNYWGVFKKNEKKITFFGYSTLFQNTNQNKS